MFIYQNTDICTGGFPQFQSFNGKSSRGDEEKVTTRLFPSMTFGCNGKIVRVTAAVVNRRGTQSPMIQIWRKNLTQPGVYFRPNPVSGIPLAEDGKVCLRHQHRGGVFRCTLNDTYQVHVQPGDILGIELPPTNDDDLDLEFETQPNGGVDVSTVSYVFEGKLDSVVNVGQALRNSTDQPLVTLLVTLGRYDTIV